MAWDMNDLQVEVSKVKQPLSLVAVEVLGLTEVGQVFVVSKDLHRERGVMKIMFPRLQGMDCSKEFLVVDVIILFSGNEQLREVGAEVPITI